MGRRILDACAAPGGKTLILAERNPEAQIVACESNARRLSELRERVAAYADRVECRLADATALEDESAFDVVLADVPCSGTGTLGRNPEIRHRLRLEDLPRQAERQRAIFRGALRAVRPGGRRRLFNLLPRARRKRAGGGRVLAEGNQQPADFGSVQIELLRRQSAILTACRRGTTAQMPHA